MTKRELNRVKRIYPWFFCLTGDIIFVFTIMPLFLISVRELSLVEISLTTAIASISTILLQKPILWTLKKLGNALSLRLGAWMMFCSLILLGFGNTYISVLMFAMMLNASRLFINVGAALLKNNLIYEGKSDEFIIYRNKGTTYYSIVTLFTTLSAGFLFNINVYLPIILNMVLLFITIIMSLMIKEVNATNIEDVQTEKVISMKAIPKKIMLAIFSSAIFASVLGLTWKNGQLLTQFELETMFELGVVAQYIAIIATISRLFRIGGNLVFVKVYRKLKDRIAMLIASLLSISLMLFLLGAILPVIWQVRVLLMACGTFIILTIRDAFGNYVTDLLLRYCKKEEQQAYLSYKIFLSNFFLTGISLLATVILIGLPLEYVMLMLLVLSMVGLYVVRRLYFLIINE